VQKDITGQRFGKLTVIEYSHANATGQAYWKCKCDCGSEKEVRGAHMLSGKTKSCGRCIRGGLARGTGTRSKTRLYDIFCGMKKRCYNVKSLDYDRYGGRGIVICNEWLNDYEVFKAWALENRYDDTKTIGRIDNNGPYAPWNCCWEDRKAQANNTRRNRWMTCDGVTLTLHEWCEKTGISHPTLIQRLNAGWSEEKALTTPVRQIRRS